MLSKFLGGVGRVLITGGTLVLLFVAYQLWGTGLQEARAQKALASQFDEVLQADQATFAPPSTTSTTTTTAPASTAPGTPTTSKELEVTAVTVVPNDLPPPNYGDPIATIRMPKIGVTRTVVQGVGLDQLKRGPGHYPDTPLPGQAGNVAIAGHRTTWGQPFHNVDKLANGDQIIVKTRQGEFVYAVDRTTIVKPNQVEVLQPTTGPDGKLENRITLTACHPKYSAAERIIVSGLLVGQPAPELPGQAEARKDVIKTQAAQTRGEPNEATIDGGLSGLNKSKTPAYLWGGICAAIWLSAWLLQALMRRRMRSRAGRRGVPSLGSRALTWSPYLIGVPVFLVALYVFFENFSRFLPANY